MTAQLPDHLVVVVAYHAVLRMESGELRTVIHQRPVRDQYPEGLPEKVRLEKHRPCIYAGLLVHGEELQEKIAESLK